MDPRKLIGTTIATVTMSVRMREFLGHPKSKSPFWFVVSP